MSDSGVCVLGLDPSIANTGYAVLRGDRVLSAGTIRTKADLDEPARLWIIFQEVVRLVRDFGVDEIAVERFRHFFTTSDLNGDAVASSMGKGGRHVRSKVNPRSMFLLQAAQTACVMACLSTHVPVSLYRVGEWKGGNVTKEGTKELVSIIYGLDIANDNVTDAIMIARHHGLSRTLPGHKRFAVSDESFSEFRDFIWQGC